MGSNPSHFKGDDLPVENVSWTDIQGFISKLRQVSGKRYRLLTEAEWEYAARGGSKSKGFKYAGGNRIADVAWYTDNSGAKTHPVGLQDPNELGIHDMSGNVWEWVSDWFGSYSSGSKVDPSGPSSGSDRVIRGGSWDSFARLCRVAGRHSYSPGYRFNIYGFRLALSP
jgi:formylglycine-generating enzyme required for sulfatase activity